MNQPEEHKFTGNQKSGRILGTVDQKMRRSLEVAEEENVRNLIKIEVIKPQKELKYKSKYADKVKWDNRVVKHGHKTMGYAQVPLNPPDQYLKKHTRPMMKAQVGKCG